MGACHSKYHSLSSDEKTHLSMIEGYQHMPLVSLERALEPLKSILPSVQQYAQLAKEKCSNPADGLTCDQSAAIMLLTMRWKPWNQCLSIVLNETLNSFDQTKIHLWFLYLKLVITALIRLPSKKRTIYRGIQSKVHRQYPKGKNIFWWDFALCTQSLELLQSDRYLNPQQTRTIITLDCYSSKDISRHSFFPTTDMVLLLPGCQFRTIESHKRKHQYYSIQLKEVPSAWTFLQSRSYLSQLSETFNTINTIPRNILDTSKISSSKTNAALKEFIDTYPTNSIVQLRLESVTNDDMRSIVQHAIHDKKSAELWLYHARITSQGALILSHALYNNSTLKKLYLNDNFIQDRGIFHLARALAINNSKLEELYLARNAITSIGARYLADMLVTNRTLKTLSLFGNLIDDLGIKYFAHSLSYYNSTLECLQLSGNTLMSDGSIEYLIEMIEYNQTLKKVHLFNCNLSNEGREKLQTLIRTLKSKLILYA